MSNADADFTEFWATLDILVSRSEIIIDRPKGSRHPRYHDIVYPIDYGYLKNTTAMDGGGIDVWRGTEPTGVIDAIICTVDLMKRDSEIKVLIGCTEEEKLAVCRFHDVGGLMKGLLVRRAGGF